MARPARPGFGHKPAPPLGPVVVITAEDVTRAAETWRRVAPPTYRKLLDARAPQPPKPGRRSPR